MKSQVCPEGRHINDDTLKMCFYLHILNFIDKMYGQDAKGNKEENSSIDGQKGSDRHQG